jgi:hypothetical protein
MPEPGEEWWKELPTKTLIDLASAELADFEHEIPEGWEIRKGGLGPVQADLDDTADSEAPKSASPLESPKARGQTVLQAGEDTELCAGDAGWTAYAATAEVMLETGGGEIRLAAATDRKGDGLDPGYQVEVRGDPTDIHRVWMSGSDREGSLLIRDARDRKTKDWLPVFIRPGVWRRAWLRLRVEVTPVEARMWVNGLLVTSAPWPKWTKGGIRLHLPLGSKLRYLRVDEIPSPSESFLPIDLTSCFNGDGLDGKDLGDGHSFSASSLPKPGTAIEVGSIPFLWCAQAGQRNHLDISKVVYRGREEYIKTDAGSGDPQRVILRVPRRQYNEIDILAASDSRTETTNLLNVRMVKPVRGLALDRCHPVPAWNAATAEGGDAVPLPIGRMLSGKQMATEEGKLWLVRIPLDPGAFQDFLYDDKEHALELDITGPPATPGYPEIARQTVGVHIFAATLVASPVAMKVGSSEFGHVFVQPQTPTFKLSLSNMTCLPRSGQADITVTDFYGKSKSHKLPYQLTGKKEAEMAVPVPVEARGLHYLDVRLLDSDARPLVRRQTTFAVLPTDTREADKDSPFGMWAFMTGHFGAGAEAAGSLMNKIGVRWSHVSKDLWGSGFSKRYRVYPAYHGIFQGAETPEQAVQMVKDNPQYSHWTVFGETALGGRHYSYFPPELLENPQPMRLTGEEEATFQGLWKKAMSYSEAIRQHCPEVKLVFGNGYPHFIATFLSRGFPRKYFDGLGLDFLGDKMYMFFYLKEVARHYGYGNVPFHICEGFYVCSGCGYYPDRQREQDQSDWYMRGFLRGLAMGIERYGAACEIWDPGSDYYYTGYGSVGLCHKGPELNPKPGYCAYGTMTLLLDRAKFHSVLPTGSVNTHFLRFDGHQGPVYAAWTVVGRRSLSFKIEKAAKPRLTDSQCNSRPLEANQGKVVLEIDPTPLWIEDAGVIAEVESGTPVYDTAPSDNARPLAQFARLDEWTEDTSSYAPLEAIDWNIPVRACDFDLSVVDGRKAAEKTLSVTLRPDPGVSPHRLRYSVLRPKNGGIVVPKAAAELGAWIYGNGAAWVALELQDANGERWHTATRAREYGFGMAYGGPHAFDGWRYVRWPLPLSPAGASVSAARLAAWQHGDGKLDLPAKLTGIILEQYGKVVCINELVPANSPTWLLGDILWE